MIEGTYEKSAIHKRFCLRTVAQVIEPFSILRPRSLYKNKMSTEPKKPARPKITSSKISVKSPRRPRCETVYRVRN